jgi:hypothetical protein
MIPNTLADKLRVSGVMRVEPTDKGCRRVVEVENEAKIFGIGGLVESSTEKSLREGWTKGADYMKEWQGKHSS